MKSKKEIIEETAAYYNRGNRSVQKECNTNQPFNCLYIGPDGKRCAFSRCCLNSPAILNLLKDFEGSPSRRIIDYAQKENFEVLKEEYRGHETEFWNELQAFHDGADYWDENGLTEKFTSIPPLRTDAPLIRVRCWSTFSN